MRSNLRKEKKPKPILRTIAVDFDGTVHDVKNPIEGKRMGGVISGAKESLDTFKRKGYKIVIFCVWAKDENSIEIIANWMNYWDCKFDVITNIKPQADAYIDDKGIYFNNWPSVMETLNNRLGL